MVVQKQKWLYRTTANIADCKTKIVLKLRNFWIYLIVVDLTCATIKISILVCAVRFHNQFLHTGHVTFECTCILVNYLNNENINVKHHFFLVILAVKCAQEKYKS